MTQTAIPFHFFRGGTSRGPYFNRADLPEDQEDLSKVLIAALGAGNALNIDGIGGGAAVTTKVAMLSPSQEDGVDVDYFFAQVSVTEKLVDYGPTCGNILVGVGPAAIEMGLVVAQGDRTSVKVRAVNTGALVECVVETPNGQVNYAGELEISGVPGTAAPISLNFLDVVGAATGKMFPTGAAIDVINGVEATCIDVTMPMMIAKARDFGLTGYESREALDGNPDLFARLEAMRLIAGQKMGLGDVSKSVMPKIGLLSAPQNDGHFNARYFMPWNAHPSLAVTGSQCLAACALAPGTVAQDIAAPMGASPANVKIEHPSGTMEVLVDFAINGNDLQFNSAGVVRTARLLVKGDVLVPKSVWDNSKRS